MNWRTKDGQITPIEELEDSHLQNIIRMLERKYPEENLCLHPAYQELTKEHAKRTTPPPQPPQQLPARRKITFPKANQ